MVLVELHQGEGAENIASILSPSVALPSLPVRLNVLEREDGEARPQAIANVHLTCFLPVVVHPNPNSLDG